MAKASAHRTRATILSATAGLALAVAFLPGAASATQNSPADDGTPAATTPPTPSQQTLIRCDARLTKAEQRSGVDRLAAVEARLLARHVLGDE